MDRNSSVSRGTRTYRRDMYRYCILVESLDTVLYISLKLSR